MTAPSAPVLRPPPPPSALEFPFAVPPAIGTVTEVADGVRWLRMPLPFALDHINLWLLRDGPGWAIVDCGFQSDATREAWAPILAAHAPITRILVTHYHPDHVGLAGWLSQYTDGGIWMTEAEYLTAHAVWDDAAGYGADALARLFTAHGLDADNVAAVSTRGNGYRRSVAPLPTTFHRITHGDTLDVGGRAWNVIVGHGHAPEHASLHCAELGVVISGDMLLPRISTNTSVWATEPEGDPVGQFLRSIRAYNALPADTLVLPSHGLPFRGAHARVAALETHHADRLAELLAACTGTPKTAAEILPVLFRRTLDHHQIYFAMGEAIAHLNHLLGHERLQRLLGADGIHRFIAR